MSKYRVFSSRYFPGFGQNTERVSLRIQSECEKIRTRKKLRIWALFTNCTVYSSEHLIAYLLWVLKRIAEAMLSLCKLSFSLRWEKLLVPTFSHFQCSDSGDQTFFVWSCFGCLSRGIFRTQLNITRTKISI